MITGYQLRAGIAATKLTAKEISNLIGLHDITLIRLNRTANMEYLRCYSRNNDLLESFFESKNIIFPCIHSVRLKNELGNNEFNPFTLTRFQLVCARIATGLNQHELSKIIKISSGTISLLGLGLKTIDKNLVLH
jgi:DNA-binding Xre family transcriptional regulator